MSRPDRTFGYGYGRVELWTIPRPPVAARVAKVVMAESRPAAGLERGEQLPCQIMTEVLAAFLPRGRNALQRGEWISINPCKSHLNVVISP